LLSARAHGGEQLLVGERFGQVLLGAGPDCLRRTFDRGVPGYHHHLGAAQALADVAHEVHAAHTRHLEVSDHKVNVGSVEHLERLGHARRGQHPVVGGGKVALEHFPSRLGVIDNQ